MNRFLALLFFYLLITELSSQIYFTEAYDIEVVQNNEIVDGAFTGGLNSAQFGEIDLNQDGILDLVVYDRFRGLVRPYINNGIADSVSYTYAPEYAELFPLMRNFLLTFDYNNDSKFDLLLGGPDMEVYKNISNTSEGLKFESVGLVKSIYNTGGTVPRDINPTSTNIPGIYDIDNDNDIDFFINQGSRTIDYHRNLSQDQNNGFLSSIERRSKCWGIFFEGFNFDNTKLDSIYLDTCLNSPTRGERKKNPKETLKHGSGLTIAPIDYDGNSSMDILIADDGSYYMKMMLNSDSTPSQYKTNSRIFKILDSFPNYDVPVKILFAAAYFIDVNNDGKKDMIAATNLPNSSQLPPFSTEEIWLYENIGTANRPKFNLRTKQFLKNNTLDFGRTSKPVFIDYNKDGLQDLLIGNGGYLDENNPIKFIPKLALLENIGSKNTPKFKVVTKDYLAIQNSDYNLNDSLFASVSPTVGDIDGDGDQDLLLTVKGGKTYLYEDTSINKAVASFKFHPTPFQNLITKQLSPQSAFLYDVNRDSILDLIVNSQNLIHFYPNFGTKFNPIFNIPLDSFYWIGGDTMRYHFAEKINYNYITINDSVAVNNAQNPNNNSFIPLCIVNIDTVNHIIDCINTIDQGVGSNKYDELNTTAGLTLFNRSWDFFTINNSFSVENVFMFNDENENIIITGAPNGTNSIVYDFTKKLEPIDTIIGRQEGFMTDYGNNSFVNGADLNNDSIVDLVIGLNTGGIKILYGSKSSGLAELIQWDKNKEKIFTIFPNPSSTTVTLKLLQSKTENTYLEIFSIEGKLKYSEKIDQQFTQILTSNFSRGVYLVRVTQKSSTETVKLIIQ